MPVWLHSKTHVCAAAVSGKDNLHVKCNGLSLESTQLRYQTVSSGQVNGTPHWHWLCSSQPVLSLNIGYGNCELVTVALAT